MLFSCLKVGDIINKRQKEVQQAFLDDEKKVLKKLEQNYADALDEINDKIAILLGRADSDQQYVIYQVEYQKALKTQVQSILETLQANEFETVSEYLANSYHDGFIGTMYDLHGQGIPLIFPIDQEAVVAAVQQETKLSEPLYTAMGKDITDLKKKITGEISRGLSSGQMYGEITRNIASWARIPKNNAARIARTEAHRIQVKATADAQFRAKEKGADVVKQWDASLDKKTRDSHRQVDGEIRELDEKFSNGLRYPGDPNGGAGEVINCRCALLQRARWALGNDYTKWSPDAEIEYSDDGTAQLSIIEAKNYKDFQKKYKQAAGKIEKQVEKSSFKPALNIADAEEFIKKYVDDSIFGATGVSYKGITVEAANAVNKALDNLYTTFNLDKLGGVYVAKGNTKLGKLIEDATAGYSHVRRSLLLNNTAMKDLQSVATSKADELRYIEMYKKNPASIVFKTKRAEEIMKASLLSGRATVPDNVTDVINHEMGHYIHRTIEKLENYGNIKSNMAEYAEKISGYATANETEYIAESFASYMKGENIIDPELRKAFDLLKKEE